MPTWGDQDIYITLQQKLVEFEQTLAKTWISLLHNCMKMYLTFSIVTLKYLQKLQEGAQEVEGLWVHCTSVSFSMEAIFEIWSYIFSLDVNGALVRSLGVQ